MHVSSVSSYPPPTSTSTTTYSSVTTATTTLSLLQSTTFPMRCSLSLLRSLSHSLHHHHHYPLFPSSHKPQTLFKLFSSASSLRNSVEHLVDDVTPVLNKYPDTHTDSSGSERVGFDDVNHVGAPVLEVKELEELPEQWRRTKLAWLCKELPAHKSGTLVRILNAQRKWMRQEDATYVAVHCMRIRENETGFKVYKWMRQQHWYRFDFALSTKLADYLGKERKFAKCREIFDDIINQGRVPSESTFHILIVAYLSSPIPGCLDEACDIYNRMIHLGGYRPRLGLHNSLFRALVSQQGKKSKGYLKQAEFVFHNLVACGLEIQKDIYGGLLSLHSYQDSIDKERIASIREEMRAAGFEEGREVLISLLRVCSKEVDVEEAERIWLKLARSDSGLSSQAYLYKMELYARVGNPLKSLELFREMQQQLGSTTITSYHKIIELLCKAQKVELAESLMDEFLKGGLKQLSRSYIDMMYMYFNLGMHEKLELLFYQSFEKCPPDSTIYGIYLDSLVKVGSVDKAEEIFNKMLSDTRIVVSGRSFNSMLSAYLSSGDFVKAEKVYDLMCQKKKDVEPELMEKIDHILSLRRKTVKKPISLKLSKEQREILVGLLLGGLQIKSDEERKNHMLAFEFNENNRMHSVLKKHIFEQYHEWIHPSFKLSEDPNEMPYRFLTISHSYFGFYADQFWPQSRYTIPKLIHRWLSPFVLAYWYMYGGHRLPSGDIVLKLKGSRENVERVVKSLKMKSLNCKVKRKGKVFWLGFLQNDATWFWKLIETYVLDQLKEYPRVDGEGPDDRSSSSQIINFDSGSDTDEASGYSDSDRP